MKTTKESGITLIGLTVTIIIIIIILSIGIVSIYNQDIIDRTKNAVEIADISQQVNESDEMLLRFSNIEKEEINAPLLLQGMTPVKWENGNEIETTTEDKNWYNYKKGNNVTDSKDSIWANAKLQGSYFVWIPRFAYKITYYTTSARTVVSPSKTEFGKIDVKFLIGLSDTYYNTETSTVETAVRCTTSSDVIDTTNEYVVHPAFTKESTIDYRNGGWNNELSGIWVAKYEMSLETNGVSTETNTELQGNIATSSSVKAVSKPGVSSWRYITPNNAFLNCLNYNSNAHSHLMKNSEWGAVAYLAYSQYGRNSNELDINNSSTFATGNGGGSSSSTDTSIGVANAQTTAVGQKASTTGNISGVFDMSGGAEELVSAYLEDANANGSEMVASDNKNKHIYSSYTGTIYGDAIFETSTSSTSNTSWNNDKSIFVTSTYPFIIRGGKYDDGVNAGLFAYNSDNGDANINCGYRVVLN